MAELIEIKQYESQIQSLINLLNNYQQNLYNNSFDQNENEDNEKAYKRGEGIFDQFEENIRHLNEIISREYTLNIFFEKCKENKEKLIEYKNEIINKLLRIKKNDKNVSKEEYLTLEYATLKNLRRCNKKHFYIFPQKMCF